MCTRVLRHDAVLSGAKCLRVFSPGSVFLVSSLLCPVRCTNPLVLSHNGDPSIAVRPGWAGFVVSAARL